jgi:hypothetical protein
VTDQAGRRLPRHHAFTSGGAANPRPSARRAEQSAIGILDNLNEQDHRPIKLRLSNAWADVFSVRHRGSAGPFSAALIVFLAALSPWHRNGSRFARNMTPLHSKGHLEK